MASIARQQLTSRATGVLCRQFTTTGSHQPPIESTTKAQVTNTTSTTSTKDKPEQRKTQAELDDELRQKLAAIAGDGGEAGVEYEDGQPVAMKRSVRENMFRYI